MRAALLEGQGHALEVDLVLRDADHVGHPHILQSGDEGASADPDLDLILGPGHN